MQKKKYSMTVKKQGDIEIVRNQLLDVSGRYGSAFIKDANICVSLSNYSKIGRATFSLKEYNKRGSSTVDIEFQVRFGFGFMFIFLMLCIMLVPTVIGVIVILGLYWILWNSLMNTCLEICAEAEKEYGEEIEYLSRSRDCTP